MAKDKKLSSLSILGISFVPTLIVPSQTFLTYGLKQLRRIYIKIKPEYTLSKSNITKDDAQFNEIWRFGTKIQQIYHRMLDR
jgi:hypothetical protein